MRVIKYLILCLCFTLTIECTHAQDVSAWHLTDEDGLPSNEIYNAFQDSKGYIWFGTDNGLARYDGIHFKLYDSPKLNGKALSFLQEDNGGRIWMTNFSGQICWVENDSLKVLSEWEKYNSVGFPNICVSDDRLLISNSTIGLCQYHIQTKKFSVLSKRKTYTSILLKKGTIYINDFTLGIGTLKNGHLTLLPQAKELTNKASYQLTTQPDGTLILISRDLLEKVYRVEGEKLFVEPYSDWLQKNGTTFTSILYTKKGEVYIGTYNGVLYFKNKNATPVTFLKDNQISKIIQDREGNIWLTSLKNGVFIIRDPTPKTINNLNSTLPSSAPVFLKSDGKGRIACSHNNGYITIINSNTQQIIKVVDIGNRKDCEMLVYNKYDDCFYATYRSVYKVSQSNSITEVPYLYHIKDMAFDAYKHIFYASQTSGIFDPTDKYLGGPFMAPSWKNALPKFSFDVATVANKRYVMKTREQRSRALLLDENDTTFWISYTDGLYFYHASNPSLTKIISPDKLPIVAYKMIKGPDGIIWAGTANHGLIAIKNRKIIKQINRDSGLAGNFVKCLSSDNDGLWLYAENCLQYYHTKTGKIKTFKTEDGLFSKDINDLLVENGRVWITSRKGIQEFPTYFLQPTSVKPYIYIRSIFLNDKKLDFTDSIHLGYQQNNILINFTGLSFSSHGNFFYKYRLIGLDTNWVLASSANNFARYPSLPPGEYAFEVKTVSYNNISSEKPATVYIVIDKPYWQQWWFFLIIIVLIIVLISGIYQLRLVNLQKRSALDLEKSMIEQDLRSSQLSALKAQMNPHFMFNALNSIQDFILLNEKQSAQNYLGKFSDLMRLYLDMSQKQVVSFDNEIKALRLYLELEAVRFEDTFIYEIDTTKIDNWEYIKMPPMLIQPYVENALKHGLLHRKKDRKLYIRFSLKSGSVLHCQVEDNGIGREASAKINAGRTRNFQAFSSGATAKRLELLNHGRAIPIGVKYTDLYNEAGEAVGTLVSIDIPISA